MWRLYQTTKHSTNPVLYAQRSTYLVSASTLDSRSSTSYCPLSLSYCRTLAENPSEIDAAPFSLPFVSFLGHMSATWTPRSHGFTPAQVIRRSTHPGLSYATWGVLYGRRDRLTRYKAIDSERCWSSASSLGNSCRYIPRSKKSKGCIVGAILRY